MPHHATPLVCVCVTLRSQEVSRPNYSPTELGGREDLQGSAQRSSLQDPRKRKLVTSVYLLVTLPHFSRCLFWLHGLCMIDP